MYLLKYKYFILSVMLIFCTFHQAYAEPAKIIYNGTISTSTLGGVSNGQFVKITVTVDNGENTLVSQVWNSNNINSVNFDVNDGQTKIHLQAPFDGGLIANEGEFRTNSNGEIVSVMSEWVQVHASKNFETNIPSTSNISWNLNGNNPILSITNIQRVSNSVSLDEVYGIKNAMNWTISR